MDYLWKFLNNEWISHNPYVGHNGSIRNLENQKFKN